MQERGQHFIFCSKQYSIENMVNKNVDKKNVDKNHLKSLQPRIHNRLPYNRWADYYSGILSHLVAQGVNAFRRPFRMVTLATFRGRGSVRNCFTILTHQIPKMRSQILDEKYEKEDELRKQINLWTICMDRPFVKLKNIN